MFTESPITSVTKKKKRKSQNLTFNEQDLTENDTPKKSKQPEKLKDKSERTIHTKLSVRIMTRAVDPC